MKKILVPLLLSFILLIGGANELASPKGDVALYECLSVAFFYGGNYYSQTDSLPDSHCTFVKSYAAGAPFRTLPQIYPLLALVPFSIPLLFPLPLYKITYAFSALAVVIFIYVYLWKSGTKENAHAFALYLCLGSMALVLSRFDIFPSCFTFLSLVCAVRKRFTRSYIFLSLAIMLKMFAVLLVPALFIYEQQNIQKKIPFLRRFSHLFLLIGICVSLFSLSFLLNPYQAVIPFSNFTNRVFHIESFPATILWISSFFGAPVCIGSVYNAISIYESLHQTCSFLPTIFQGMVTRIVSLLFVITFLFGYVSLLYTLLKKRLHLPQVFIAILLVTLSTSKSFSPQYLIWLSPLIAYTYGLRLQWIILWGVVCLLTTFIYPFGYTFLWSYGNYIGIPLFFLLIALRNIFLATITFYYYFYKVKLPPS